MLHRISICILTLLCCAFSAAAFEGTPRRMEEIAHDLITRDMKPDEWQQFVKKTAKSYESWINDYPDGNLKRFLDDKLLEIAPGVLGGSAKALKKMCAWVALYLEFREPPPSYISDISEKYRADIEDEMKDFSWERAAQKIKNRKKEHDEQEAKEGKKPKDK
jgi:hypothetical protein